MVFTHAYAFAGVVAGTALAYDDVTGFYALAAEQFNAEAFAFGFTTVFGATYTFLVSHDSLFLKGLSPDYALMDSIFTLVKA